MSLNLTQIEWVKNPPPPHIKVDATGRWHDPTGKFAEQLGYTWNPITGCLNHVNGMCKGGNFPCYAYRLANTRLKERYLANDNIANPTAIGRRDDIEEEAMDKLTDPFYPRFWPERLYQKDSPRLWERKHKPKGIFVCDMSDLFGIGVPEKWTKEILHYIRCCPNDRFYLLTKQPQNLAKFSPFPDNCWVGVTSTGESMFHNACYYLEKVVASVKYLSLEPLLSFRKDGFNTERLKVAGINQVIIGAQTKPYKPPKTEWVREIVEAADKAGAKVFLKNNLSPLIAEARKAKGMWEAPHLLRQELPKG